MKRAERRVHAKRIAQRRWNKFHSWFDEAYKKEAADIGRVLRYVTVAVGFYRKNNGTCQRFGCSGIMEEHKTNKLQRAESRHAIAEGLNDR